MHNGQTENQAGTKRVKGNEKKTTKGARPLKEACSDWKAESCVTAVKC